MSYIKEMIAEVSEEATLFTDLDAALIGVSTSGCAVYSLSKIIEIYMEEYEMTEEDAFDFYSYNTERFIGYMGEYHPIILDDTFIELPKWIKEREEY